jgi:hypothetical protein
MTTCSASPISQPETCWITSSALTATSLRLILKSTLSTCAEHGTPNSQFNPCSSKFKIVQIILRQAASSLDTRSKSTLATPKYLQLDTSWVHVAGGMKSMRSRKLGHTSSPISPPLTAITNNCRVNLLQQLGTTLPTPLSDKLKTKWLKQPLDPLITLPRQLRRIEAWWQLSQRPTHVLSSSSRITQMSCGNPMH